jgi:hypothetical protein
MKNQWYFDASDLGGCATAKLDRDDQTARIRIPDQWFTREDLKELIGFLKLLRKELKDTQDFIDADQYPVTECF